MKLIKPRIVLLIYLSGVIAFCAASIRTSGNTGLAMLNLTLFFESVVFPTIVALGIRGIGKHTKRGAGLIVGGVAGGAAVRPSFPSLPPSALKVSILYRFRPS
jgi:MFS transporter, FHS family, L-fucose permease